MSKYIKKFDEYDNYDEFTETQDFLIPNVSHCVDETSVHYNPKKYNWIKYHSRDGIIPYSGYGIDRGAFDANIIDTLYDEETGIVTIVFDQNPTQILRQIGGYYCYAIDNIIFPRTMKSIADNAYPIFNSS